MTDTDEVDGSAKGAAPAALPVLPPPAALIEIVALVVLPGLLDYFVAGFPTLSETQPHFFWLPVLLLTLQYGSPSGLLAAGVAIVVSSLLGWPEQEIGENHFSYLLRIWLQPVLWIAAAVVLGQLRLRQIEAKQSLERSVAVLERQRSELADHARRLRDRCDRLERIVATRHDGDASALLAAIGRSQSAAAKADAERALHDSLTLAFGTCRLTLLELSAGELRASFRHGDADETLSHPISSDTAFFDAVVRRREALSVLTPAGEQALGARGLAAVPVIADDAIAGALLLEACSPDQLDETILDRLAAIAMAMANAPHLIGAPTQTREIVPVATEAAGARSRLPSWRRVRRGIRQFSMMTNRSGRRG